MSKAFVKESQDESGEDEREAPALLPGGKNYISPAGYARLKAELKALVERERPEVVKTVSWAAALGDRSENADYIYGKKRLRETDQVFFGASVKTRSEKGEQSVTIVGVDEVDPAHGKVSWISPIAKALLKCREGDSVTLRTPAGEEKLQI